MSENANQPTEEPTQRRWEKAFEDGQLAFSSELIGGLILLVAVIFFMTAGQWFFRALLDSIRQSLFHYGSSVRYPENSLRLFRHQVEQVGFACLAMMAPILIVTLVAGTMQTRFNISLKVLELKWNRLAPQQGLKRIFSTRSLNRGGVAILKASAIVAAAYWIVTSQMDRITATGYLSFGQMMAVGSDLLLQISLVSALLMVSVGVGDLGFQIWKQRKDLMMTKQEVRDEQKDIDGDPQIKARIRKIQSEMAKRQITRDVPRATVVVTNPTHFAVALRYEPSESDAPIVVAKGADHLAKQIIKIAKDSGVAVVERKPVARFLYSNVDVGREIPAELYQAVAEILNYITQLKRSA